MKTKKTLLKNIILFSIGICLSMALGCSGEDGETGPQGPAGKDGVDGQNGQDGNANVIASEWIDIEWTEKINTEHAYMNIPADGITEFVENGGVAMMYLKSGSIVLGLPFTSPEPSGSSYYFSYGEFSSGESEWEGFRFEMKGQGTSINGVESLNYAVRYVLVPANIAEAKGISQKWSGTYEETIKILGERQ